MIRALLILPTLVLAACTGQQGGAPVAASLGGAAAAQADAEAMIRALEEQERRAVLAGDVAATETVWHPAFTVNSPNNTIVTGRDAVVALIRAGIISYTRFDRVVEHVAIHGDIAVAMGAETVQPKAGPQAGQPLQRRYTNVWRLQEGRWRMIARHASVVPREAQVLTPSRR